ncbi:MAG: hypothetical protein ABF990_14410 [Acetobacter sp.]|uniref:hypothetical protein n=1 Tax=Acetobacter sp. TaxID=440 RepID=UPI0039ED7C65
MTLAPQEIVSLIGQGVKNAFKTSIQFLGIEIDRFNNTDIHPEYLTTVEVAKSLISGDRHVSLETHMKELRTRARQLASMDRTRTGATLSSIDATLAGYRFGKADSQRLDILVRLAEEDRPPLLMVEAKLGDGKLPGIIQDIDRILRLFDMYDSLGLLTNYKVYGAAVFHSMEEGNASATTTVAAQTLLTAVNAYLALPSVASGRSWLHTKAGLLQSCAVSQPVTGYVEDYDDGQSETIFAKKSFRFAPGLILLGNDPTIRHVSF